MQYHKLVVCLGSPLSGPHVLECSQESHDAFRCQLSFLSFTQSRSPSSWVSDDWYWRVIPRIVSLFPLSVIQVKHRGQGCCGCDGQGKQFVPLDLIVSSGILRCQGTSLFVIKQSQFWNFEGSLFPTIFSLTKFNRSSSSLHESLGWFINSCSGYHHIWSSISLLHFSWHSSKVFHGS